MKLPINLETWIQENESSLEPPINNKIIDEGKDFFVMAVGGPNARTDYHVNETEVIVNLTRMESEQRFLSLLVAFQVKTKFQFRNGSIRSRAT